MKSQSAELLAPAAVCGKLAAPLRVQGQLWGPCRISLWHISPKPTACNTALRACGLRLPSLYK